MWHATLRGLPIGDGTRYRWTDTPEFFGIDRLRSTTADRAGLHGEIISGPDLLSGMDRTFQVVIDGGNEERYALKLLEDLQTAWSPADTDIELTLSSPTRTVGMLGRPRRSVPDLTYVDQGVITVALQYRQSDPRFYEPTSLFGGPMGITSGGLAFPFAFPFRFGTITPGMFRFTVGGNTGAYLGVIAGAPTDAMVDPIFKLDTGVQLVFSGLVVPTGWYLLINWQNRQALITGDLVNFVDVAHYIDRARSDWWTGDGTMPPGARVLSWVGGGSGGAFMSFRSAWIL